MKELECFPFSNRFKFSTIALIIAPAILYLQWVWLFSGTILYELHYSQCSVYFMLVYLLRAQTLKKNNWKPAASATSALRLKYWHPATIHCISGGTVTHSKVLSSSNLAVFTIFVKPY